jgi:thioredoxin 1
VAGPINDVSDNSFQAEVLESDRPVLVDFWAPWCGPCRVIAPHIEELNEEQQNLKVVKLNVDDNPQTAASYDVLSIPTLILFKNGQPARKVIGALPKKRLEQEITPELQAA